MGFKEALAAEVVDARRGPRCTVCALEDVMSGDDWADFTASLEDATVTTATLARALNREGYRIPRHTLGRHRKRECSRS